MNRHSQSAHWFKNILLAASVIVFALGMYLVFGLLWALLLLIAYWLLMNPIVIVGLGALYFILFAPSFYPILTDEPPFQSGGSNDSPHAA